MHAQDPLDSSSATMLSSEEKLPFYEAPDGRLEPGTVAKAQAGQGHAGKLGGEKHSA